MSRLRVNTIVNRTNSDKVTFPFGIGVTNGIQVAGVVTATSFVGSGVSLTGVQGTITLQDPNGNNTLTGISTIRVGTGMTLTSPGAGIASIRPTGVLETLTVTGVSTFNGAISHTSGEATFTSATVSDLTSGRVVVAGASGSLQDSANLSYTTANGLRVTDRAIVTGIITASAGIIGNVNATGVSTAAFLQATTVNVSGAATVGSALTVSEDLNIGRHVLVSGITTLSQLDITTNSISANVNSSGVSTIAQLVASTVNATGIITATTFDGDLTGNVTGDLTGNIFSSGISTANIFNVISINSPTGVSTIQQLKGDTISITGILTASSFSGNATGLTGIPNIIVGFTTTSTILPSADASYDLGAPSRRWNNIYSADMHFSNEGNSNSVDGTWGSWTLQEGENDIFMLNNRTGKKYKINLTEV